MVAVVILMAELEAAQERMRAAARVAAAATATEVATAQEMEAAATAEAAEVGSMAVVEKVAVARVGLVISPHWAKDWPEGCPIAACGAWSRPPRAGESSGRPSGRPGRAWARFASRRASCRLGPICCVSAQGEISPIRQVRLGGNQGEPTH